MRMTPSRIGFIATHFNGTDRVSLESACWSRVLTDMGHECFFFTGESDEPEERTVIVPEADSHHPDVELINHELYDADMRSSKTSGMIQALRFHIKQHLHQFIHTFDINILIVENALSLPVNIPLGLALTELIAETGIPTVARHHDFVWERPKYMHSPAGDYIRSGFPPKLPSVQHIVATRMHADQLGLHAGVRAQAIPYTRDFQRPPTGDPVPRNEFADTLGIQTSGPLLLSASPLIDTSRIEIGLAFIARMQDRAELLITGLPDHGEQGYIQHLRESAELLDVPMHLVGDHLRPGLNPGEGSPPTLEQCYQHATLVVAMGETQAAFAEIIDGIYHRRPVLTAKHSLPQGELKRTGIRVLTSDDHPVREAVQQLWDQCDDALAIDELVELNFELGKQHFGLDALQRKLNNLLRDDLTASSN